MKELVDKSSFIKSLSKKEFDDGCIKFNIPEADNIESLYGEGVWGWLSQEDRERYSSNKCHEKMTAILLNAPINYLGMLKWGDEVVIRCHGEERPTLDPDWIRDVIWDGHEVPQR